MQCDMYKEATEDDSVQFVAVFQQGNLSITMCVISREHIEI